MRATTDTPLDATLAMGLSDHPLAGRNAGKALGVQIGSGCMGWLGVQRGSRCAVRLCKDRSGEVVVGLQVGWRQVQRFSVLPACWKCRGSTCSCSQCRGAAFAGSANAAVVARSAEVLPAVARSAEVWAKCSRGSACSCSKCRNSACSCSKCRNSACSCSKSGEVLHLGEVQRFCIWAKC